MAKPDMLLQAINQLAEKISDAQLRLTYLKEVDPDDYESASSQFTSLESKAHDWIREAQEQHSQKGGLFSKKQDHTALIAEGNEHATALEAFADNVTQLAKKPAQVTAAISGARSRIAAARSSMPELQQLGADPKPALASVQELETLMAQAQKYADAGDYHAAAETCEAINAVNTRLSRQLKDQAHWVQTLPEDLQAARALAKETNATASRVSVTAEQTCPPHPKTLERISRCSTLFEEALQELERASLKPPPPGATTLVYSATDKLRESLALLEEVEEIEKARNEAFEQATAVNEQIADMLTASSMTTQDLWDGVDKVATLLASGDVFSAAGTQARLLEAVNDRLTPALPAPSLDDLDTPDPIDQPSSAEPDTAFELPAAQQEKTLLALDGAVSDPGSEPEDPYAHLDTLRDLVRHLASEVQQVSYSTPKGQA